MSRPLRIQYANAWYHVMNRGRRGEAVFHGPEDYHCFIDLLKEASGMWEIKIAAYCLMDNHYHLLVQTPEANLSRCMRHINGLYTQSYNRRHKSDGSLFRGRYKSVLVDADGYLLELVKYIHRNPLRAGIVNKLEDYVWSSHAGYVSSSEKWNWLYKDFVLLMLSEEKQKQKKAYKDFVREVESSGVIKFFKKTNLPAILGREEFIAGIRRKFNKQGSENGVPQSRMLALSVAEIKQIVAMEYKTTVDALTASCRGRVNEPRDVAIFLSRKNSGKSLLEIGAEFKIKQFSSVSTVVNKIKKRVGEERKLKKRVQKIEQTINKSQQ